LDTGDEGEVELDRVAKNTRTLGLMPKPILGLIGGIGSGKSLVAAELARLGGRIIAGDQLGHEGLRKRSAGDFRPISFKFNMPCRPSR
jgi:2-phosphoglycerate kinase